MANEHAAHHMPCHGKPISIHCAHSAHLAIMVCSFVNLYNYTAELHHRRHGIWYAMYVPYLSMPRASVWSILHAGCMCDTMCATCAGIVSISVTCADLAETRVFNIV
jgi:hypothetical protein